MKCGGCGASIEAGKAESCWWCLGELCNRCWDLHGHCGHEDAEAVNAACRLLPTPELRRNLFLTAMSDRDRP